MLQSLRLQHCAALHATQYVLHTSLLCRHPPARFDNSGLARATELHGLLRREVMLRRLKRDVLSQLPPKRRQVGHAGLARSRERRTAGPIIGDTQHRPRDLLREQLQVHG